MPNPEHVDILNEGVEVWNEWRSNNHEKWLDLSGADFSNTVLTAADLSGVDLTGADLGGANLSDANLSSAYLGRARFIGANVSSANLSGADLIGAELIGTNLDGTNLVHADLGTATVGYLSLTNTNLNGARGLETVTHVGPSEISISTIYRSQGKIPALFLRGCGVPEDFITYMQSLTVQPIQFYSCFISYSSIDQGFAERLYADLQNKGVRCWFAPEDLKIGAEIRTGIDESIRLHDKLLLVLSGTSVKSQWVQQEVETALAKEREQGRTVLFPIRLDDAVMQINGGWPAYLKNTRNIGDFTSWKNHDSYLRSLKKLLRGLKAEEASKPTYTPADNLERRAVLSPRNTIIEEWDKVTALIVQAAKRNGLVVEGELVSCGQIINQLYEAGKISEAVREEFFILSKWHRNIAFNTLAPVEPGEAINFVNKATELQKVFAVDTPPLP